MDSIRYPTASLKPYREEPLIRGHLWVFSGSLQQPPYWIEPGGLADIKSAKGQFVARGYYNPYTDIALRILTFDREEAIDVAFFRRRIQRALARRAELTASQTDAYRVINAEGDGLPGLIVDRYADVLVMQIHTLGMEHLRSLVVEALTQEIDVRGILLRNDVQARRREGLELEAPVVVAGEVPAYITIQENGLSFLVDPWHGQKTGFFLDQRDKRAALRKYAPGKRVLNCFSYTGGFSVYAAVSSAETRVTSVDISASAMELAVQQFKLNGLDPNKHEFLVADVFEYLEMAHEGGELFDIVVLDPPAFAKTQHAKKQALQAYQRLNLLGMRVLPPGSLLLSCSCTSVVSMRDLHEILKQDAQHLSRQIQVLESYTHGIDHPVNPAMPETAYLKAIFCRVK
jgi:23S rRNA (cytosine1962-C5)-methyltransferase